MMSTTPTMPDGTAAEKPLDQHFQILQDPDVQTAIPEQKVTIERPPYNPPGGAKQMINPAPRGRTSRPRPKSPRGRQAGATRTRGRRCCSSTSTSSTRTTTASSGRSTRSGASTRSDSTSTPVVVSYKDLIGMITINAYNPIAGFPYVVGAIRAIETMNQTLLAELAPYIISPVACDCASPVASNNNNNFDVPHAVACGDADPQTLDREAYQEFFEDITRVAPTVGPIWATYHLECTQWPVRPRWRYTGALAARNVSYPILIVEPNFDPAGPLHDAIEVRKRYPGTGLLVQNSYGHASVAAPSACTAKSVREYLEAGTMPAEGTVCEPDVLPLARGGGEEFLA